MTHSIRFPLLALLSLAVAACAGDPTPVALATNGTGGDAAFAKLADDILQDNFRRDPSGATDLGIHKYDDQLNDFSRTARLARSTALKRFRTALKAIDAATLSPANQLDREQLLRAMDANIQGLDVIQPWAKDPDSYSGGVTTAAYVIMKRAYAPAADRLRSLIAREKRIPAALEEARRNLDNPPQIYTEIAIEQIDGNISLFQNDVPAAFKEVTDTALLAEFGKSNAAVIAALGRYKEFLQNDLLPR